MYEITCSGCGTVLSVDERHFGRIGKCRKCGQRIRIRAPQDDVPKTRSPRRTQLPQVVFHENKAQPCHTRDDGSQTDQSNSTPPQSTVRPASKAQKEFARDLGVNFEENITNRELSALIDSALPTFLDSSPVEMVNQLEKRGLRAMLITWPKPEVAADPCKEHVAKRRPFHVGCRGVECSRRRGVDLPRVCTEIRGDTKEVGSRSRRDRRQARNRGRRCKGSQRQNLFSGLRVAARVDRRRASMRVRQICKLRRQARSTRVLQHLSDPNTSPPARFSTCRTTPVQL